MSDRNRRLRRLPSVDKVLQRGDVAALLERYPRDVLVAGVRRRLAEARARLQASAGVVPDDEIVIDAVQVQAALESWLQPSLQVVINATGVVLHTNLGRAPLSVEAVRALADRAGRYINLEFELESGKRGGRAAGVQRLLCELTGAESALVVNNNAAAVYLALRALAQGREVIVSRGELVEIGGSFRVPEVMEASGARLVEVGTTNKTRLSDYERALTPETALLLKVHPSNFAMRGFTEEASLTELAALAHRNQLPFLYDLGSATLLTRSPEALPGLPLAGQPLKEGVDLVCFSGDKLVGGSQSGILLGRTELVTRLAQDPMARALRVGKLSLIALEATLTAYRGGETSAREVPILGMLLAEPAVLKGRAQRLARRLKRGCPGLGVHVVSTQAEVGGGSMPETELPSFGVVLRTDEPVERLAERLRRERPSVLCRIRQDQIVLDVRTVLGEDELRSLTEVVLRAVRGSPAP